MSIRTILTAILGVAFSPVLAQKSGTGLSTSPGMPLVVGQRATTPYNSSGNTLPLRVLPRFWHTPDSVARATQEAAFTRFVSSRTRIPEAVFRQSLKENDIRGQFYYRLIINPDGSLQPPILLLKRFTLAESSYSPEFIAALEQVVRRNVGTLQFAPAAAPDTVVVPMSIALY